MPVYKLISKKSLFFGSKELKIGYDVESICSENKKDASLFSSKKWHEALLSVLFRIILGNEQQISSNLELFTSKKNTHRKKWLFGN